MGNTLRELQLCDLQILKDFRSICEHHGFRYYLCGGSLLGAVRHQGFIPWDDDIDIMMPREDYRRFLKIAQEELGEQYFVQNAETDKSYAFAYTHIRKNNTTVLNEWDRKYQTHHGAWIDISPLVKVRGSRDRRFKNNLLRICYFLIMEQSAFDVTEQWLVHQSSANTVRFVKLVRKLPESMRRTIRTGILHWIENEKHGKFISYIWSRLSVPIPAGAYEGDPVFLPFEDDSFPVPKGFEEFLTRSYGDYMTPPPPEKRNGGHGEQLTIDLEHDWTEYVEKSEQF